MLFDTHAHYDDEQFGPDREELLASMPEQGVGLIVNPGCDLSSSRQAVMLSRQFSFVYAAVGIHPENCADFQPEHIHRLRQLAAEEKVVAIGEIGLDYYWEENASPDVQKRFFEDQLLLAKRLCLPVIIHDREAHGDTMELLQKHKPKGVLPCFSGSVETARQAVKLGLYLGFGGSVTFKNARHPVEAAGAVPLDRLLLETDAPYMAPVPCRGKRNDSSLIRYVAEKIAEIRGISAEQVLNASFENARALFSICTAPPKAGPARCCRASDLTGRRPCFKGQPRRSSN